MTCRSRARRQPPDRTPSGTRPRSDGWRARACWARSWSGTTSSSTGRWPRWSSTREFFPTFDPLVGTMIAFAHLRRRLRHAAARRLHLRPLRRPHRAQDDARADHADHGPVDLRHGPAAHLRQHRRLGAHAAARCCGCCRASAWAASGAARCCCASSTHPTTARGWFSSWPQLGVPIGLLLSTGGAVGDSQLPEDGVPVVGLARAVPAQHRAGRGRPVRSGCGIDEPPAFKEIERGRRPAPAPAGRGGPQPPQGDPARDGRSGRARSVTFNVYNAFLVTYIVTVLGAEEHGGPRRPAGRVRRRLRRRSSAPAASPTGSAAVRCSSTGAGLALVSAVPIFALVNTENAALDHARPWSSAGASAACTMFGPEGVLFAERAPHPGPLPRHVAVYQTRRAPVRGGRADHLHLLIRSGRLGRGRSRST